jgi:large subunit ribosomal protein L35
MPKMKTHKGTAKRYRTTGSGKWIRPNAWRGHHLENKSSRRTRRYAGMANVAEAHVDKLEVLMPYAKKGK